MLSRAVGVMGVIAVLLGGCNLLTGADQLGIEEGGADEGGAGGDTSSGAAAPSGGNGGNPGTGGSPGNGGAGAAGGSGAAGAAGGNGGGTPGPECGDGQCNNGETCESCAGDCGQCDPCGNGQCDNGETCETCASDCGACDTCAGSSDATTALDAEEIAFVGLLNDYRAQNGLGPVTACTSLNRAAQGHSEDMRDQNYFDHSGLDGSSPWGRSCDACYELGCGPQTAMAENIAAGNAGAQGTFTQWKNSPGHNANMLGGSFTVIGIGRATGGGQYGSYWTNVFGGDSEASCN